MSEYRFLYWDDYGTPERDKAGETPSTNDSSKDDSEGSRQPKGV